LVSTDAIATNGTIATAIRQVGADYLLAVKANQPRLRADIEACFNEAPVGSVGRFTEHDKGHGRIERREIAVIFEELHSRIPDIAVTEEPSMLLSSFIHGIKRLPVGWTPPA
jgi:predicted transposase YbfD/YdcC